MKVIAVVINEEMVPTLHLQLACREIQRMCRATATLNVKVCLVWQKFHLRADGDNTREQHAATPCPRAASGDGDEPDAGNPAVARSRPKRATAGKTPNKFRGGIEKRRRVERQQNVRSILPRGLVWHLSASKLEGVDLNGVLSLQLGSIRLLLGKKGFNEPLESIAWPPSLEVLKVGFHFNQPLENVIFPATLKEFWIGCNFNQDINGVLRWPPKLKKLVLDPQRSRFNKATRKWPASLKQLTLGHAFNQPLRGLPLSIEVLELGAWFNSEIIAVKDLTSLEKLHFGRSFDQPINGVTWPASLKEVRFGAYFNQPINGVAWPASLKEVQFGAYFNKPIDGVAWPAFLEKLSFGRTFDQPIDDEICWPASVEVTICGTRIWPKNSKP